MLAWFAISSGNSHSFIRDTKMSDIDFNENDWHSFAQLFESKWNAFDSKTKLLALVNNDKDIAMIVSQVSL